MQNREAKENSKEVRMLRVSGWECEVRAGVEMEWVTGESTGCRVETGWQE